jgi:septum formation protein
LLGAAYEVSSVDVPEEVPDDATDPVGFAQGLAREKALAARTEGRVVITADTVVAHDDRILGKPADLHEAVRMLQELSGREHRVVTALAVLGTGEAGLEPDVWSVTTRVSMRDLDEAAIDAWVARGELLGCAGAYNIEGHMAHVAGDECYQNVAGLPCCHLYLRLAALAEPPAGLRSPWRPCEEALSRECELGRRLTEPGERS